MTNFNEVMTKFKNLLQLKSDTKTAEILGMSRATYSERKQRDSIPYENLINFCKKEKISIDLIFKNQENLTKNENYKTKLENSINKLNENESKYFYFLIESKLAEKNI